MTRVIETTSFWQEYPGSPDRVVEKLVAMGWEVVEQRDDATILHHELIPGGVRAVLRT